MFDLDQKLVLEKFELQLVGFFIDFSVFSHNGTIFRNLNHCFESIFAIKVELDI